VAKLDTEVMTRLKSSRLMSWFHTTTLAVSTQRAS